MKIKCSNASYFPDNLKFFLTFFQIPERYLQPASNMQKISPSVEFYLPKDLMAYINMQSRKNGVSDWKYIVKEVLLEIYEESISNFSAKGSRGERMGIDPLLFVGLFGQF